MKRIRNNIEGQVYRCSWQKKGRTYTLTCSSPVKAAVSSANLEDATDKLISEIMTLTGDGEPYLQFVPDLPPAGAKQGFFEPRYYGLGYNAFVEWTVSTGNVEDLTTGGVCRKCKMGQGIRTDVRRVITTPPRYDACGFYKDRTLGIMLSEDILKHLMPYIKRKAKLVPVDVDPKISKKVRKKYFELSFEPDTSTVIPKQYDSISGWRCKACKVFYVFWYNPRIAKSSTHGIRRSNAVKPVIFVDESCSKTIAVNKRVHDALCTDKAIRGLVLERIAIFDAKQTLSPQEVKRLKLPLSDP